MYVSPANISIPATALSVNPLTEQVARENIARMPIVSPRKLEKIKPEPSLFQNEKELKRSAWDPFEHPDYDEGFPSDPEEQPHEETHYSNAHVEYLNEMLSGKDFLPEDNGYTINFSLPEKVLENAMLKRKMDHQAAVIMRFYRQSSQPSVPANMMVLA